MPEVASRAHVEAMTPDDRAGLRQTAGVRLADVDAIAVTCGPGLSGALLVGVAAAKALAVALGKPLYGVNHLAAHVAVDVLEHGPLPEPAVALLVSGGHSSLLLVPDVTADVRPLGATIDDAAGEAFDKVARLLGLPFPGGPYIDRAAREGDPAYVTFPRGLTSGRDLERHRFDFSFSGLKTAVARWVEQREADGEPVPVADVAASFQEAVVDVLTRKAVLACREHGVDAPADRRRGRGQLAAARPGRAALRRRRDPGPGAPAGAVHRQRRHGRGARRPAGRPGPAAVGARPAGRLLAARHDRPGLTGGHGWHTGSYEQPCRHRWSDRPASGARPATAVRLAIRPGDRTSWPRPPTSSTSCPTPAGWPCWSSCATTERNVGELAEATGASESATSHALRLLRAHRVVAVRREGRLAYYRPHRRPRPPAARGRPGPRRARHAAARHRRRARMSARGTAVPPAQPAAHGPRSSCSRAAGSRSPPP